jgi:hypothetical protein
MREMEREKKKRKDGRDIDRMREEKVVGEKERD